MPVCVISRIRKRTALQSRALALYENAERDIATIRNSRRSLTPKRSPKRATQPRFWGALRVFCDNLLEHRLAQAQVGNQLLELAVFLFQHAQALQFGGAKPTVFLAPHMSVASAMSILRHTSPTAIPSST